METHGMKFVVDTREVAKGFRDYKAAVDGIFTSLDKFEAHVAKTMAAVSKAANNRGALNGFKKSMEAFGNVKIDPSAARRITALAQALNGFKAPSPQQAANTKRFFTALAGIPDISNLARSMRALGSVKSGLAGFQAPSSAQSKRLVEFGKAMASAVPSLNRLRAISGISGIANELASISIAMSRLKAPSAGQVTNIGNLALALRQFNFSSLRGSGPFLSALSSISNFKAPSPAQIRNLQAFMNALGQLRVPPNANELTAALNKIAAAAASASNSLRGLRGGLGGLGGALGNVGGQARGASLQMMGLQNAFSGTFQIGSALRSLLGSLTIAELGRNFFKASDAALTFKAQMAVVNKEVAFGAEQLEWVNETSTRLGVDMLTAETGFAKVSIAASKAGMSVNETRHAFEGFSTAMTVLGTKTDRQNDVWLAVQQVLNKGYLSAEELNQQLNEHLPGAMAYASEYAESLGMSLEKGLKNKALDADKVLAYMAKRMKEDFGPSLEAALNRPSTQMTILRNNVNTLFQKIGEAGASQAFTDLLKNINASMEPGDIERYAQAISDKLVPMINKLSDAFTWLRENWDSIKGPLGTTLSLLGKWMLITGALQIGRFLVTPIFQIAGAARVAIPLIWDLVYATRALQATNLAGYLTQLSQIANPQIAAGVQKLSLWLNTLAGARVAGALGSIGRGISGIGSAAQRALPFLGKLVGVVGTGLAGAWAVGQKAAEDSAEGAVAVNYSAGEVIVGIWYTITDKIGEWWNSLTDWIAKLWNDGVTVVTTLATQMAQSIGIDFSGIGTFAARTAVYIAYAFQRAFEGIVNMAIGMGRAVGASISDAAGAMGKLLKGDFEGAGKQAMNVVSGRSGGKAFMSAFKGYEVSGADFNNYYADVGRGFNAVGGWVNDMGARGRREMQGPTKARPKKPPKSAVDLDAKFTKDKPGDETEGKGGKGKKGKKGESPEAAANRIENLVDQLMDKFSEVDPIGGLYRDFVKTLTDQAHTLLNDKGYADFIANIKTDSADGEVSVQALIKAMGEPGNLANPVMQDLKTRYKKDVGQIIDLLIASQAAYEDARKEATVKAMDFRDKSAMDLREAIGDSIPSLKQYGELLSKLTPIAKAVLPNKEFSEWLGEFREGIEGGDMAAVNLGDAVIALAGKTPILDQALKKLNITAEQLASSINGSAGQIAYQTKLAERAAKFGGNTLFDMDQEIAKLQLTEREAGIYDQLTQAIDDYNNSSRTEGELTAAKIAGLEAEIRARQNLADQLQRNKEFFENNGIRSYINEVKDAGAAVNELDKNVLQSLEDQLFSLGTTGKFSFKSIFDTIQQGIVRFSSQQIVKTLTENLFSSSELEGGAPSLMGSLFGAIGIGKYGASTRAPLGSNPTNAMWVQMVGPNGQISTGPLGYDLVNGGFTNGRGAAVTVGDGTSNPNVYGMGGTGGIGSAANDNSPAGIEKTVGDVAKQTATTFGSTFTSMMPMIGMAFAGTFKSPIAQIGAMFLTMMLTKMMSAQGAGGGGGGLGGIFGKLFGGIFGGGGGGGGINAASLNLIGSMPGIFKEGGMSNSPVGRMAVSPAVFANAPHYREGTHNTSGIPAILHDNEAVIPLSRGRKVPVEMSGGGGRQAMVVNNNFNVTTPDANSFRKSKQQIATEMHMQAGRAYSRNHG